MAYSSQPLELALDSLGVNYLDGVEVVISPAYRVSYDAVALVSILAAANPTLNSLQSSYDGSFERKILADLQQYDKDQKERERARKERIEARVRRRALEAEEKRKREEEQALEEERQHLESLEKEKKKGEEEERRRREEEERQRKEEAEEQQRKELEEEERRRREEEEEWRSFEEERLTNEAVNSKESAPTSEKEVAERLTTDRQTWSADSATPPAAAESGGTQSERQDAALSDQNSVINNLPQPPPSSSSLLPPAASFKPVKINFSDFEGEADPFADLELKTLNDLAELQTILSSDISASSGQPAPARQVNGFHALPKDLPGGHQPGAPQAFLATSSNKISHFASSLQMVPGAVVSSSYAATHPYHHQQQHSFAVAGQQQQLSFTSPGQQQQQLRFTGPEHRPFFPAYAPQYPQQQQQPSSFPPTFSPAYATGSTAAPASFVVPNRLETVPIATHHSSPATSRAGLPPINGDIGSCSRAGPSSSRAGPTSSPMRSQSTDRAPAALDTTGSRSPRKVADNGELKPSRSVGDIISELQKEARHHADQKRKSVQTPPPRPPSSTGLEDWVPWPQIAENPAQSSVACDDPLAGLDGKERQMCSQLAEMGFPIQRLAVVARSVGADSQKLLNFCFLIDRLTEEGLDEDLATEAVLLHSAEEKACRKHLAAYGRLAEIGFGRRDIHRALIQSGLDYQKALEQLLL